jgi:hypothetical protein
VAHSYHLTIETTRLSQIAVIKANSTRNASSGTERDGAGDVRLAIEDDRNRRRDHVSFLASPLPGAIWRSLAL